MVGSGNIVDPTHLANDETYAYDDNGNRDTVTNTAGAAQDFEAGADNRLLEDVFYTYTYDNEGNRTRRTEKGTGNYTSYVWDHRNRLISVENCLANHTHTSYVGYTYDANNRLILRSHDADGYYGTIADTTRALYVQEMGQVVLDMEKTGSWADFGENQGENQDTQPLDAKSKTLNLCKLHEVKSKPLWGAWLRHHLWAAESSMPPPWSPK